MLFKIITVIDFDLVVEKYVKKNYILKEFKDTGKDVKSTNKTLIVLIVTFRLACGLCSLDGSKLHPLPWYLPNWTWIEWDNNIIIFSKKKKKKKNRNEIVAWIASVSS